MNKKDYFSQVFNVTKRKLYKQSIKAEDIEKFSGVFNVMLGSDDLFSQLYLLMQVKKLESFGKYLLYVSKKIDDKVINTGNVYGNLDADSDQLEKEILAYLGVEMQEEDVEVAEIIEKKPRPIREKLYIVDNKQDDDSDEDKTDETIKEFYRDMEAKEDEEEGDIEIELIKEDDDDDEPQPINLELLDIERNPNPGEIDMVFELPSSVAQGIIEHSFIEHHEEVSAEDLVEEYINEHNSITSPNDKSTDKHSEEITTSEDETDIHENTGTATNKDEFPKEETPDESAFEIPKETITASDLGSEKDNLEVNKNSDESAEANSSEDITESDPNVLTELPKSIDEIFEEKTPDNDNIELKGSDNETESASISENSQENSEDDLNVNSQESIKEEIAAEGPGGITNEEPMEPQQSLDFDIPIERELARAENTSEEAFIEREQEPEEANNEFMEYERAVMRINAELKNDFEIMMQYAKKLNKDYAQRDNKIKDIIGKSYLLEQQSKELSFEVITNIYQTFRYSFEKISDGKYDISEDTLQLFEKGLELVISLLKEDNISGYDKQMKDLDKIRKALIIENKKKVECEQKKKEEEIIESSIHNKYPDHFQREIIFKIRKKILDTEKIFNSINEVNSEFILYDRLRLLGENLNNFKELVQNAKAINLERLAKLSEGGYILIKYIQNYRIDPSSEEMKDIFQYITYNLKLLVLDKPAEDIDVFISYLNDPVKIFTEQDKISKENLKKENKEKQ